MAGQGEHRFAPAKINLYLHVGGKRADGYHNLSSLIVFADAGDRLSLRPNDHLSLRVEGPFAAGVTADHDNMVLKAARALKVWAQQRDHPAPAVELTLEKNLPVASGIGGGSSDAAATLHLLAKHWALPIHSDDLQAIGLTLGADVPVCLRSLPTLVSGIGEVLMPIDNLPELFLVLVNPRVAVPTSVVFSALTVRTGAVAPTLPVKSNIREFAAKLDGTINDLAAPAKSFAPIIMRVEQALVATDGCLLARMSGSGATCFGLYASYEAAAGAAKTVASSNPLWWVTSARLYNDGSQSPSTSSGPDRTTI